MEFDLGARLRALREMHGLSQRELAKRTGVTNGMISLIEQNRASPAVGSLKKLLDGFPISLSEFFAHDFTTRQKVFYRADELTELAGGKLSYRQIGGDLSARALQVIHEHYAPGADTGRSMLSHAGEESGVVVRGRIELTVGGERTVLEAGDAYYFESRLPHRFRCVGDEPAEIVSACTPPSF
ncbi:cupin domain-containing protein [Oceanibacterium hippocampi]|uniref:HTH-type transcriptional regulator PuuR n=1 Tax=Oceanibacterium hippocampi TaxID=745714 RepID=A0A1Y5R8Y3_9PROT|nr:cupin domain-containing protein [Oceanibacterium hippocampi]SLN11850.1 HTH-type transcriptional regulator PuuR [Oceanibacterium hippocampi]